MPSKLTYTSQDAAAVLVAEVFAKPFVADLVLEEGSQVRCSCVSLSPSLADEVTVAAQLAVLVREGRRSFA